MHSQWKADAGVSNSSNLLPPTAVVCFISLLIGTAVPASAQQCQWSALGGGIGAQNGELVQTLAVANSVTGPVLYAGGLFSGAGGMAAANIAKWDGMQWSPLGTGTDDQVWSLASFDDGTGSALYAGGLFTTAGGVTVNGIAKWDGKQWSALGSGVSHDYNNGVFALAVFNDGTGAALYAAGIFTSAGGVAASNIAKWDGKQWSPVGGGVDGNLWALTVFNGATGPALYASGRFSTAGGQAANNVAKWDGKQWSALGSGVTGDQVYTLTVFNDGSGPALFAGGLAWPQGFVYKWNGTEWSLVGSPTNTWVYTLAPFNDGTGAALYAGGKCPNTCPAYTDILKWDGSQWAGPLGGGLGTASDGTVHALAVLKGMGAPSLIAGGWFAAADAYNSQGQYTGGIPVNNIAKWSCTE